MLDEVTEDIMSLHDRPYVMQNTNNAESHDEVSTVQSSCILSSERLVAKYANDVKLFNINCRESNCANGDVIEENSGTAKNSCSVETKSENEFRIIDVSLQKGVLGLGFCIDGGVDTPTGSAPISVKRLFKGNVIL
jgi:hypothetical protein